MRRRRGQRREACQFPSNPDEYSPPAAETWRIQCLKHTRKRCGSCYGKRFGMTGQRRSIRSAGRSYSMRPSDFPNHTGGCFSAPTEQTEPTLRRAPGPHSQQGSIEKGGSRSGTDSSLSTLADGFNCDVCYQSIHLITKARQSIRDAVFLSVNLRKNRRRTCEDRGVHDWRKQSFWSIRGIKLRIRDARTRDWAIRRTGRVEGLHGPSTGQRLDDRQRANAICPSVHCWVQIMFSLLTETGF